ncbi:hypothetical protein [Pedobacter xixiisoli]|uniref:Phosphatidylcholine 1-acylhydrolase n=1 Tax=Pedobacter xixiisoli TaxID=1476464 RepID=A0A285ZXJ7_9SPHI|nr:hypothetical protein [Pedobacter xixiisoli]SOD14366.1 hypothetical protein SAMN06297358_1538 [Pedobacter xixiisoli]
MRRLILSILLGFISVVVFAQTAQIDTLREKKQQANLAYISLYKENSELSYTSPAGEIGAPSSYILNGKLTTSYVVFAPRSLPVAFSINPDFTARVRNERSAGVRTPSFRLGGTVYLRLVEEVKNYRYAQLSYTHHSNGQDGDAVFADGTINTSTGNFNTNYLTTAYRFGYITDAKPSTGRYYSYNHKVGLEWHKWFDYEPALNGDYGFTRLNYDFSFRIYQIYKGDKGGWRKGSSNKENASNTLEKETWRFNGQFSYAINEYDNHGFIAPKRRLNIEVTANYSLSFMQNVFMMASFGYYGEDPYNIYFKDRYAFMRFGLSSTFSRYGIK